MSDSLLHSGSLGVKVKKIYGEQLRRALVDTGVFDRSRRVKSDEGYVYLPILPLTENAETLLRKIADFELVEIEFTPEERRLNPEDILGYSPSFEIVGDIAIVEPENAEEAADALMSVYKSVKTVIAPISDVEGEFRTRRFKHVAGLPHTTTIHREHGLRYCIDLEGAYFSPRLGTERLRVIHQISPGDTVLDMFAGVGPFALLAAKKGARVIAIDKNPVAVRCLKENARLNKAQLDKAQLKNAQLSKTHLEILEGDAAELALRYENSADHVIMNLPHSASQFLAPAIKAAKTGGVVHYYAIAPVEDLYADMDLIKKAASNMGASAEILYQGIVRSYAPRKYNIVMDFRLIKP